MRSNRIIPESGYLVYAIVYLLLFAVSCKKTNSVTTAFYYWKTNFKLSEQQVSLLQQSSLNRVYIHFFDVNWSNERHSAYPNAVVKFSQPG